MPLSSDPFLLSSKQQSAIRLFRMQTFWISFQSTLCLFWLINEKPLSLLLYVFSLLILYVNSHYHCNIVLISVALLDNWLLLDNFDWKLFSKSNIMALIIFFRNPNSSLFSVSPFAFLKSSNSYFNPFQMSAVCL